MKELGKEISDLKEREAFLMDNADAVEEKSYMKRFDHETLQMKKEQLSVSMIRLNELKEKLDAIKQEYKLEMKPLEEEQRRLLTDIKNGSEWVTENCYKFVDQEERTTTYYNKLGDMVEERPCLASEMQRTMFVQMAKAE